MQAIKASEARANFGALLRRVSENGERVVIEKNGRPQAAVIPIEELERAGDHRLQDFVEAASDWFWEMDENYRFSYFSDRFGEVTGVPQDALLGRTREETGIPGVSPALWEKHLADLAAQHPFRDFRHPRVRPDGRKVYLSINGKPIFDENHRFKGYRGTGRDITEQVLAEQNLRDSEAALAKAQALAHIGNWRWSVERDELISASEEYARIHGVGPAEVHDHLAQQMEKVIHPEDRDRVAEAFRRFDEAGEDYEIEYRIVRPNGEERQLLEIGEAILDGSGRAVEQIGTVQDITEFKRIDEELRQARDQLEQRVARQSLELGQSEARLKAIMDHAPVEVGLKDTEGRYLLISRQFEERYGLKSEDVIGKLPTDLFPSGVGDAVNAHDNEVLASGQAIEREMHDVVDGQPHTYLAVKFPVRDNSQRITGVGAVAIDITERKRAEKEAERDRQLLASAVEALDEGFVIFDANSRIVLCNNKYREIYGPIAHMLVPGATLEDVARATARNCIGLECEDEIEAWVRSRVGQYNAPADPFEQTFKDGRWIRISEARLPNGWTVGTRSDLTDLKRTEKELRRSEQRFRDYTDASSDWVWEMDADLRFTYMSENVVRALGVRPEWHYGKTREELLGASADIEIWAGHLKALREHKPFRDFEYLRVGEGIEEAWLSASGIPLFAEDGAFLGYRGTGSDITARKETEQALEEREAQLRQAQEMARIGVFIWDDVEDSCLYCSEELADLLGISVAEYMATRSSHKSTLSWVHEEDRARYDAILMAALKDAAPYDVDYRVYDSAGKLWHWREMGEPALNAEGRQIRTFGTVQDITTIRTTEDELRRSEKRYRELFEESPVAILEEDWTAVKAFLEGLASDGVKNFSDYFHRNLDQLGEAYETADRFGITQAAVELYRAKSKEELRESMAPDMADPDELMGYGDMITAFYEGAEKYEYEADEIACDGTAITTRIKAVIPPTYRDDWSRVLVTIEDITERARAEEQLRQAQKMEAVGQLTGGIAHDFNNLLAVVMGNAEMLKKQLGQDDRAVGSIITAVRRGAELTRRLLAFSRQQPLRPRVIDLGELVSGMSELLARTLGETIEIQTAADLPLWSAEADRGQVENALLNLALNARDAMPGGGKLTVECSNTRLDEAYVADNSEAQVGDYVILAVTDEGTGMTAEVQAHAFEPFFTTKEVGEGSGLGLSMIYGFAKQSGGHVAIYSELGRGTTVKLYLPRAEAVAQGQEVQQNQEVPRGSGEMILVIEDDPDVRSLAAEILAHLDYQVLEVTDAAAAHKLLADGTAVDLILSDVILPGGTSGPAFAEQARAAYPDLKIIFMSGYPAEAAKRNGFLGSDQVLLNKPFQMHQLAQAVHQALGKNS